VLPQTQRRSSRSGDRRAPAARWTTPAQALAALHIPRQLITGRGTDYDAKSRSSPGEAVHRRAHGGEHRRARGLRATEMWRAYWPSCRPKDRRAHKPGRHLRGENLAAAARALSTFLRQPRGGSADKRRLAQPVGGYQRPPGRMDVQAGQLRRTGRDDQQLIGAQIRLATRRAAATSRRRWTTRRPRSKDQSKSRTSSYTTG